MLQTVGKYETHASVLVQKLETNDWCYKWQVVVAVYSVAHKNCKLSIYTFMLILQSKSRAHVFYTLHVMAVVVSSTAMNRPMKQSFYVPFELPWTSCRNYSIVASDMRRHDTRVFTVMAIWRIGVYRGCISLPPDTVTRYIKGVVPITPNALHGLVIFDTLNDDCIVRVN